MKINLLILTVFLICSFESIFVNGQGEKTLDGTCGVQGKNQNCGDFCCSQTGFCGNTVNHCGTGCQVGFGKCGGGTPVSVPKVPAIAKCQEPGTVAITFDDGPGDFTNALLDSLRTMEIKATFFVNGNAERCIYDYAAVLIRAMNEGHQIGHHTWSHLDLATLNTKEQILYQVTKLEGALLSILGVKPKFFRLPFGSGVDNGFVMDVLSDLGYTVVQWDIDSNDWRNFTVAQSLEAYNNATGVPDSHISLNHDRIKETALELGPKAVELMQSRQFKLTTVGQCLGFNDPNEWYTTIQSPQERDPNTWFCTPEDKTGP